MRTTSALTIAVSIATMVVTEEGAAQRPANSPQVCATEGVVTLFCGPSRPEDLYAIPRTNWIVSSAIGGGLHLIDVKQRTSFQLYPSASAKERLDSTRYPTCQGPPDAAEKASFSTIGVSMRLGASGVHTLYAIRYPTVSRVHVFDLDVNADPPSPTWIGCVEAPERILLNSIVPLADGGFLASHFYERDAYPAAAREKAVAGQITGELLRWHARKGWAKISGSEASGPNGVEVSRNGEWAYVAEWGRSSFFRLSLDGKTPRREAINLDFRPDNVHWAPDGMLLVGGATDTESRIVKIDPLTFKVTELIRLRDTERFFHASVAAEVGNEIWLGTARGDRIAIHPLPPKD
jgi:hypothetical protein